MFEVTMTGKINGTIKAKSRGPSSMFYKGLFKGLMQSLLEGVDDLQPSQLAWLLKEQYRRRFEPLLASIEHPGWPKRDSKFWLRWKDMYAKMLLRDNQWFNPEDQTDKARFQAYSSFLYEKGFHGKKHKPYGERELREIKKAGDEGYLD